ncbi:MAG TPA: hypothetical protein VGC93_18665 [Thermoanaerobaculia bacterium]
MAAPSSSRPRPAARGPIAPGDLVAAFAELAPEHEADRRAIAVALGIRWSTTEAAPAPPPPAPPPVTDEPFTPPERAEERPFRAPESVDPGVHALSPVVRSRLTHESAAPRRMPEWIERAEPLERPAEVPPPPPELEPLLAPGRGRSVLSLALATPAAVGELDLPAIVRRLARGDALSEVPRQSVETLAHGVRLFLDVGDAMLPFLGDVEQLEEAVGAVAGADRLDVLRFAGCPTRGAGRGPVFTWSGDWSAIRPPQGARVLCVTDLGIGRPASGDAPASAGEWLRFHARLRAEGCPLLVLNPYEPRRWPPRLAGRLPILHWARTTTAAAAAKAARRGRAR